MKARPITINKGGICRVPLSRDGKQEAVVSLDDYEYLISLGVSPNWRKTGGTVMALTRLGQTSISRILTDARAGQAVRYKDGNPLNLRRDNLLVKDGWSLRNDRQELSLGLERFEEPCKERSSEVSREELSA